MLEKPWCATQVTRLTRNRTPNDIVLLFHGDDEQLEDKRDVAVGLILRPPVATHNNSDQIRKRRPIANAELTTSDLSVGSLRSSLLPPQLTLKKHL